MFHHVPQSITLQSADQIKFTLAGKEKGPDEKMSIAQYFKKMYNINLRYPRLPCVQVCRPAYHTELSNAEGLFCGKSVWKEEVSTSID